MRSPLLLALAFVTTLSGCSDDPAAPTVEAIPADPPVQGIVDPVAWQGNLQASQCIQSAVNFCHEGGPSLTNPTGGSSAPSDYFHDPQGRDLASGRLELSWRPLTPTTDVLHGEVLVVAGCPEDCSDVRGLASETGPSPLVFVLPAFALEEGVLLAVRVTPATMNNAQVSLGQSVQLEGELAFV